MATGEATYGPQVDGAADRDDEPVELLRADRREAGGPRGRSPLVGVQGAEAPCTTPGPQARFTTPTLYPTQPPTARVEPEPVDAHDPAAFRALAGIDLSAARKTRRRYHGRGDHTLCRDTEPCAQPPNSDTAGDEVEPLVREEAA